MGNVNIHTYHNHTMYSETCRKCQHYMLAYDNHTMYSKGQHTFYDNLQMCAKCLHRHITSVDSKLLCGDLGAAAYRVKHYEVQVIHFGLLHHVSHMYVFTIVLCIQYAV